MPQQDTGGFNAEFPACPGGEVVTELVRTPAVLGSPFGSRSGEFCSQLQLLLFCELLLFS